jgi:hypothetical protein
MDTPLEEQIAAWLAQNPRPLVLPKPRRTFGQWTTWLRAEGFIDGDMIPLGYGPI